ncbi:hypothetical protein ACMFMF_007313 [Clarireedia jacksonii]
MGLIDRVDLLIVLCYIFWRMWYVTPRGRREKADATVALLTMLTQFAHSLVILKSQIDNLGGALFVVQRSEATYSPNPNESFCCSFKHTATRHDSEDHFLR